LQSPVIVEDRPELICRNIIRDDSVIMTTRQFSSKIIEKKMYFNRVSITGILRENKNG